MQKKFLQNIALLVFINLLIKPFWIFGIDRVVQNQTSSDYGLYYALYNFTFIFSIFLDLGIANYNSRSISQNHALLKKRFEHLLTSKIILFFVYLILTFLCAIILNYDKNALLLLLLLALNQGMSSFILYLRSNLAGLQKFRLDSLLSSLDKFLMVLLCIPLVYSSLNQNLNIYSFAFTQTIAYFLAFGFIFFITKKQVGKFRLRWKPLFQIALLKQTFPFALLGILMLLYGRMDAVMLERLLPNGKTETAIYAEGYRLLDAINTYAFLFAGLLLPMFSKLIQEQKSVLKLLRLSGSLMFISSILVAGISFYFRNEIMLFLYPNSQAYDAQVFAVIMMSFIPSGLVYVFGTLLTANHQLRLLNKVAIVGVALNFILNLILIPQNQALGAAITTFATQGLVAISHVYFVFRNYFTPNKRL